MLFIYATSSGIKYVLWPINDDFKPHRALQLNLDIATCIYSASFSFFLFWQHKHSSNINLNTLYSRTWLKYCTNSVNCSICDGKIQKDCKGVLTYEITTNCWLSGGSQYMANSDYPFAAEVWRNITSHAVSVKFLNLYIVYFVKWIVFTYVQHHSLVSRNKRK